MAAIAGEFPFTKYFSNAPQPLFNGRSFAEDWDIAEVCIIHNIKHLLSCAGINCYARFHYFRVASDISRRSLSNLRQGSAFI